MRQTPLTCSGHTRPVVDLAFSGITPYGYFLISACKGERGPRAGFPRGWGPWGGGGGRGSREQLLSNEGFSLYSHWGFWGSAAARSAGCR